MDHDFYKLDEAAKEIGCTVTDLLKWGAAGKIELCIWYDGYITHLGNKLFDYWRAKGAQIPDTPFNHVQQLLPLVKEDVMRLALLHYEDFGYNKSIEIFQIKWPGYEAVLFTANEKEQARDVSLTEQDLFLTHETLATLQAELHQPPTESAQCLDEKYDFHSKELKIALEAWTALFDKKEAGDPINKIQKKPGGAISAITKWLEKNYPGESGNAYARIAQVINPFKTGGAPERTE